MTPNLSAETEAAPLRSTAMRRVVLVGKPNVGKSVLFHALTGRYATVSNYSGTTLDLRRAKVARRGVDIEVVDTPGLLSLSARSDDEAVTRDELLRGDVDLIVQVANARDLCGALTLNFELSRLGVPMILVLNLWDEAQARGVHVDAAELEKVLGLPVLPTVAVEGKGIAELQQAIEARRGAVALPPLSAELSHALEQVGGTFSPSERRLSLLALTGDDALRAALREDGHISEQASAEAERVRLRFSRTPSFLFMSAARGYAQELAARTLRKEERGASARARALEALGRWSLRPVAGGLMALAVLWGLYELVGKFGAQTAVDFFQNKLFGAYLNPAMTGLVRRVLPWKFVADAFVGPYGMFTMAITYAFALILPIVTTFFFAFSLLEDSGYLPRFSVVTDRVFRLMGLNGKAVLPMLLGLGCGTMAVVTTRILETRRERLLVSFLLALAVPCSAQLGVVLGMAGGSAPSVLLTWLGVMAFTLLGVGWCASRVMPGACAPFVIEIPPMRVPRLGNVARKVGSRLKWYLKEVVPLFIYATLILYALDLTGGLALLERACAPLLQGLLGLPREATGAFLLGFLRRDYGAAGLFELHRAGLLAPRQVAVSLVCITLFMPCFAQFLITLREQGWRATAAITAFVFSYALAMAAFVNWAWKVLA